MPELTNPIGEGLGISTIGLALLIVFLAILFVGLIGAGIYFYAKRKQLKYFIPLHKKIGNNVIKVGVYKAKDFKIGFAGDKLWFIPKLKKYISPATLQTGSNEYTHFEREDGEWINISYPDIDLDMKKAKVKYVSTDMRSNRIAISNIIDQRFVGKKTWWEQYGHLVTHVIFYLVVCVCMVVIFYQWSDIVTRTGTLFDKIVAYEEIKNPSQQGVLPAMFMLIFRRFKW